MCLRHFVLGLPLHLVAVVLEPDLHLGGRQSQRAGQVFALGRRQVALLPEAPLELVGLCLGEEHAPLPLLHAVLAPREAVHVLGLIRGEFWRLGPRARRETVDWGREAPLGLVINTASCDYNITNLYTFRTLIVNTYMIII